MALILLQVKTHFDAAHALRNYEGRCANIHGHRWVIEVTVGPWIPEELDASGLAVDFADLKKAVDRIVSQWDHEFINNTMDESPSAENLGLAIFGELRASLIPVREVNVWETPENCAIIVSTAGVVSCQ
jgi:6-pyruvoyltetrahydropterin/6-carboxytetrahydropterin synthase